MKTLLNTLITMLTLATASAADLQTIPLKTIEGKDASLKDYAGKVVLIVNVASECGYTSQYAGMQSLHAKYANKGFAVLGFPCNDFGGQPRPTPAPDCWPTSAPPTPASPLKRHRVCWSKYA